MTYEAKMHRKYIKYAFFFTLSIIIISKKLFFM